MSTRRIKLLILLLTVPLFGLTHHVPKDPGVQGSSRGTELVYELTFNDTAPFGTEETSAGTSNCTTHGADSTDAARADCESAGCGGAAEGDGSYRYDGVGADKSTEWCQAARFAPLTKAWVKLWIYVDEDGLDTDYILFVFRTTACSTIGGGYSVRLQSHLTNAFQLNCDDGTAVWTSAYTDQVADEYMFMIDLINGDMYGWNGDLAGAPQVTCSGTGGDAATPFTGFEFVGQTNVDEQCTDHVRIYSYDPRGR
jgi:hypothetical protein